MDQFRNQDVSRLSIFVQIFNYLVYSSVRSFIRRRWNKSRVEHEVLDWSTVGFCCRNLPSSRVRDGSVLSFFSHLNFLHRDDRVAKTYSNFRDSAISIKPN